jgi:hypothetical protein
LQVTQIITKQAFESVTGYVLYILYYQITKKVKKKNIVNVQVEETFGAELSKREFKVDPEMYSSESRAKLDRTAKIVAKEGVKTELLVPPQAALQK